MSLQEAESKISTKNQKSKSLIKESTVFDRVKEIVVQQLGVDSQQVTLQANFSEDLGADSLDTVELVMAIEEEFGLEIPDENAEKIVKLSDAVEFITKAIKNN